MNNQLTVWSEVSGFTDSQLVAQLQQLTGDDRKLVARLIVYLGEVDARGLYREQAHSSMFGYLVHELRMSEAEAYLRLQAARLARQYPAVIEMIASGAVHLSALGVISRFVTPDNCAQLLERVRGKTKREVQLLVAELYPKPDVPAQMRKLPERLQPSAASGNQRTAVVWASSTPGAMMQAADALACRVGGASAEANAAAPSAANAVESSCRESAGGTAAASRGANAVESSCRESAGGTAAPSRGANAVESSCDVSAGEAADASSGGSAAEVRGVSGSGSRNCVAVDKAIGEDAVGSARDMAAPARVAAATAGTFALEVPGEKRGGCTPLGRGRYRLQLTATQALHDKLEQLQHVLRHQVPDGDLAVIVERAVDLLLSKVLRQRFAQTASRKSRSQQEAPATRIASHARQPSSDQPPTTGSQGPRVDSTSGDSSRRNKAARSEASNSRYIPREVLREVYARDGGQCAFVGPQGRRCPERGALEVHHVFPFARRGKASVENLKLACRCHNTLFAEQDFGREFMRQKLLHAGGRGRANEAL